MGSAAIAGAGVLSSSVFALTGCSSPDDAGSDAAAENGSTGATLNFAPELGTETLDPAISWDSWAVTRFGIGETPMRFDEKGAVVPWLAESAEVADDNLTWTVKFRDDVMFSSGEPMTATKVVESIEHLYAATDPANGGTGNPQGYFTYSSIAADDDAGTVTIVTEQPTTDLAGCLAYPWMVITDVAGSDGRDWKNEGPICTGPYAVESFNPRSDLQLVRNENYWDGEVPFGQVSIVFVPESTTRNAALLDGSADVACNISAADREALEKMDGYTISTGGSNRVAMAHINQEGPLGNDDLRKAVIMAIDGQTIADYTTEGMYTYGYAIIPSTLGYGYDELSFDSAYNPDAATKLLDAAGIVDSDGDGIRELDGEPINLRYPCTSNRGMDLISQAQVTQLAEIGIGCTVQLVETQAEYFQNKNFDLVSSNEVTTPTGDPGRFMSHWYSASDDNYSGYANDEYDKIYEELQAEFDADARREYIIQLEQILLDDDAVLVYGYYNTNLCGAPTVSGVFNNPSDFYWVTKDIAPA